MGTYEFMDAVVAEVMVHMATFHSTPSWAVLQHQMPGPGERPQPAEKDKVVVYLGKGGRALSKTSSRGERAAGGLRNFCRMRGQAALIVIPKNEVHFPSLLKKGWFKNRC